jgi:hypothetical protein
MNDIGFHILSLAGKGYCCSQILIILALEAQSRRNADLVRAMAGCCVGAGRCDGVCGVLMGAACLLALYAAKGSDRENSSDRFPLMLAELNEWFETTACRSFSGIRCRDILGEDSMVPNPDRCGSLLVDTWHRVMDILLENGFDPSEEPNPGAW